MAMRNIVEIDEEKCDGCGLCVIECAEGALEIRDGKAKIIKEMYCDGLGACIGECPQEALTIVKKEADHFDEEAMEEHLKTLRGKQATESPPELEAGCPGAKLVHLQSQPIAAPMQEREASVSALRNWPVQIHLLPVSAPFFQGAELLIAADCVPFAMGGFHSQLLQGKILAIGCPKLDDTGFYIDKLSQIFANNEIKSITIGYMEVPCCAGLLHVVHKALEAGGKAIPVDTVKVSIRGELLQEEEQDGSHVGSPS
ncbi:MAG: 4Fe-4S binding protein [Deltaproteobacteria bacterium]|nr:4Fe-4S binding protein [Deltaproteobacteria bacterium]